MKNTSSAQKKLHTPIAQKIFTCLQAVFIDGKFVDQVLEQLFKNDRQLGARDRKTIAETVFESVRWARRNLYFVGIETANPSDLTAAQLWKLLFATWLLQNPGGILPSSLSESSLFEFDEFKAKISSGIIGGSRSVRVSIPDWLDTRGEAELGTEWTPTCEALNQPAPVFIRANRLKTDSAKLRKRLLEENTIATTPVPELLDGLRLNERANVFRSQAFADGWFEVQDGASQRVAEMVGAKPGERIIDACAGAGGKTLAMASMMKGSGKIIALDVFEWKLKELERRARRAGASNIETRLISSTKVIKRLAESADRVLLDVPCSGVGVLRRNPDAKWKLTTAELERLNLLQTEILESYPRMLKPGGILVYATCSIFPSENQMQIEKFLAKHAEYNLIDERKFRINDNGFDGFYVAVLKKS